MVRRKLGLKFGDNDFTRTFQALLRLMRDNGLECYDLNDKAKLVRLINRALPGVYWIAQDCGYSDDSVAEIASVKDYIQLREHNIYVDHEVDEFLERQGSNLNHDFHVLDTTGHQPYIYSC